MVNCSSSDADNWKCSTCSMHWSFKILFLVRFSHTLFSIGQHTLHNFHLLLTAIRVTDYNMMYGGPILQGGPQNVKISGPHGAPKC